MSIYFKLKKSDRYWTAIELKKIFPEIKLPAEEMADRLCNTDLVFFKKTKEKNPFWIRFTWPFAIIVLLLLWICLPIAYMFTGKWGYEIKFIRNWFSALEWT